MSRQLRTWVHVPDETGAMVAFGPGDDVPEWAAVQITGTKAWAPDEDQPAVSASLIEQVPSRSPLSGGQPPAAPAVIEMPPKAGPGSGGDAWIAYARQLGLTVADDAPRGDVIEAVEAHHASKS